MSSWQRVVLVLLIVVACVGCDQVSKRVVEARLPRGEVMSFAGDTVRLQYAENPGAFLNLGASLPEPRRTLVFTGLVALLLASWLVFLLRSKTPSRWSLVAGALVCGGGIGNWIDRVARSGYVVDFLQCGIGPVRTGIFNLADVAITAGVIALLLGGLVRRRGTRVLTSPPS